MTAPKRRWFQFRRPGKRFVALVIVLLVVAMVWALWGQLNQWEFRRALPSNAEDVHEWFREDGFLPDYRYKLKAKISDEQFHRYIERFELTPHSPQRRYSDSPETWLRWQDHRRQTEWWDPSESLDETFVRQVGDTWTYAKREREYLYLQSINH